MKKRVRLMSLLVALISLSLFIVSGSKGYAQEKGSSLIIHFAYAQQEIHQGDVWKIYLSVSDPQGNMSRIAYYIEQSAVRHKPGFIYLKKGMEKGFTGYIAVYINSADNMWGDELNLNLSIIDRSRSEIMKTFDFPLRFDGESMKPLPPDLEKDFKQRIATINIQPVY
jgi:hypothetical protein